MLKRLLIALVAVLLAPLAVELALRVSYDRAAVALEIVTQRGKTLAAIPGLEQPEARKGRIPHPYVGWDEKNRLEQIAVETQYFRAPEADDRFEVLIVGGSVAGLVGQLGARGLGEALSADPRLADRRIRVMSHGRGSFKQPQQATLISFLLSLGYRPDVILNVDGFNEVALGMDNATYRANPLYPHWPQYAPSAGTRVHAPEVEDALRALDLAQTEFDAHAKRTLEGWTLKSAILGRMALSRVRKLAARCGELQTAALNAMSSVEEFDPTLGPALAPNPGPLVVVDSIVRGWVETSRQIDAMARNHGLLYLQILQPTLHDEGSKPLTPKEIELGKLPPSWVQGVELGYPRLREAGAQLVEAGVAYRDGSMLFRELTDEAYYDGCHFRGAGMDVFTDAAAAWILELLPE